MDNVFHIGACDAIKLVVILCNDGQEQEQEQQQP